MKTYDLVIIGSGTAAQAASSRVRAAGWSVALVDHRPFGGCALRGCDPKRVLISGAEAIDAETRLRGHGVTGEARIDWRDLMTFKRSFTDAVPRNLEGDFAENGIDAFHGIARVTGRDAIVAEGREFKARYTLIAASSEAQRVPAGTQRSALAGFPCSRSAEDTRFFAVPKSLIEPTAIPVGDSIASGTRLH
jgi:glutathione reductase (NADPH)